MFGNNGCTDSLLSDLGIGAYSGIITDSYYRALSGGVRGSEGYWW